MPARLGRGALAAAGYVVIAAAYAWPLPLRLGSALLGTVAGDTGVYVWNLWLFRHLIVAHRTFPFFTLDILSLTPPVPLTLHNYTALADAIAYPLLPLLGTVTTFNVLVLASGVVSALAMFVFARRLTGDAAAAWIAGLVFGFSPFMSARATEHFSLIQTAPLVTFALSFQSLQMRPTIAAAAGAGLSVALAFFCDPYYAVYCVLIGAFTVAYSAVAIGAAPIAHRPYRWRMVLDGMIAVNTIVVACIAMWGGWRFTLWGMRVSMTQFYTPVFALTLLAVARVWLGVRPRLSWTLPTLPPLRAIAAAAVTCAFVLSPVISAMGSHLGERSWIRPKTWWRSSAAGMDLLGFFVPNPMHPWFGRFFHDGVARMPEGFVENVGSVPWVLIGVLVIAAAWAKLRVPRYWIAFTAFFALLTLGPFIRIGGVNTYVPTPWALLRYVPIVGAARMPTRMTAVVMLGLSVALAFAVAALRARVSRRRAVAAAIGVLLAVEMLPAPRALFSAEAPAVLQTIAADPRPVRVMNLPFGVRDGLFSFGNTNAAAQFYQTFHGKELVGGYMSRLPRWEIEYYNGRRVTRALMELSEGREIREPRRSMLIARARQILPEMNIGYILVDTGRAPAALVDFAREAFDLTLVQTSGQFELYSTPLARSAAKPND